MHGMCWTVLTSQCSLKLGSFDLRSLSSGRMKIIYIRLLSSPYLNRALDLLHTIFICSTVWQYFISFYGDTTKIDVIPWWVFLPLSFIPLDFTNTHVLPGRFRYVLLLSAWSIFSLLNLAGSCHNGTPSLRIRSFS